MSSPVDLDKGLDPVLQYAPRWARENGARTEESWDDTPAAVEPVRPAQTDERPVRPAQLDDRSAFSGDRAANELFRQLALNPSKVPEPIADESHSLRPLLLRIGALIGVAAGVAGLIVVLPGAKQNAHEPQASDVAAGPQYSPHVAAVTSQSSSHQVKLVPVEATDHQMPPVPPDAPPVRIASIGEAHANPPPAEDIRPPAADIRPPAADIRPPAAYVARPEAPAVSVAPAPTPAPTPSAQDAAPVAPPKAQKDPVQTAATEPPDSQKDIRDGRSLDRKEIASLLDQAETLVHSGDLSGARVLLQRAAEAGDADAALELAGTFDPKVLRQLGAIGIAPDPARARKWYERAAALGSVAATKKLAEFAN